VKFVIRIIHAKLATIKTIMIIFSVVKIVHRAATFAISMFALNVTKKGIFTTMVYVLVVHKIVVLALMHHSVMFANRNII